MGERRIRKGKVGLRLGGEVKGGNQGAGGGMGAGVNSHYYFLKTEYIISMNNNFIFSCFFGKG